MELQELRLQFAEELAEIYPRTEIRSFFHWLVEAYLEWDTTQILRNENTEVPAQKMLLFQRALDELKTQKPIQYILGETEFYGLVFKVNPSVLIPRPETEELVDWIVQDFKDANQTIKITEVGTGSGCISVSLAKNNSNFQLTAMDISAEALAIAKQNADLNQISIDFIQQDVLATQQLENEVDVLVSNPPYVRQDERHLMQANVLDYEPHVALFVKNNSALIFYEKLIQLALAKERVPKVYVEINMALAKETVALFKQAGFSEVILKKDIFNKPRMIKAVY